MGRRSRRRSQEEVELNLAAMLDMAFQLLTFFILTFKPAPIEGQVSLRLPPPQPVANVRATQEAGSDISSTEPVKGVNTLTISVFSNASGEIAALGVGEAPVPDLPALNKRLQAVFADPGNPFDQVILQVGEKLRYDELMRVVEVCTRQVLPDGQKLSKLSFVEAPD